MRVEVDADDPAFKHPTKPIGPVYSKAQSERIAIDKGWTMAADGEAFRRVVASPQPLRVLGLQAIRWLLEHGALVIATGQRAVIGSLDRIEDMINGTAGTQVCTEAAGGADAP